ncbi:ATP-binding protein [Arvimicrobium flavum]|uniref:ATP-binding protein n=1 Tax=Arvimicrobium flavum TaxID=3393320 RepID=UPI00237C3D5D|nr:ATP-binding protein [Mesorhizobium shangrilense]
MSAEDAQADETVGGPLAALRRDWPALAIVAAGALSALAVPQFAAPSLVASILALAAWLLVRATSPHGTPDAEVPELQAAAVSNQISAVDLAAAVPDPLIIFEASSSIAYANEAAHQAFGVLQNGMSLLLKFRAPEVQELIGSIVAGHIGPLTAEYSERVPIEATYRITGGSIGTDGGLFFLLFKDQSESRRIDRMRADFIANASHELRTPLASISGFVETLLGPARDDPAARERFLKIMQDQTGRMSRLIDDLLSLSRLEMKPHGRPTAQVDLRQLLENVLDTLRPLAGDLSVAIETDIAVEQAIVAGDRDELFQVFANLVENACKYGRPGGRIVVSMARFDNGPKPEICVTVKDFGPGIPEEHIPRITERFYRVDAETSRSQKGTGLGLAIVKHILTRHNGRLVVRSQVGIGSQFAVFLPAK